MAKKRVRDDLDFSEDTVKKKRKFPIGRTVFLSVLLGLQVFLLLMIVFAKEDDPQDIIREYNVTVTPQKDGSLDMVYEFVWTPLDEDEPLTWIDIGTANEDFSLFFAPTEVVQHITRYNDDEGMTGVRVNLTRAYRAGETIEFSFRINQRNMLCRDGDSYFYEWVPGWFNYTPVEQCNFRWKVVDGITSANHHRQEDDDLVWGGSMDCGTYRRLRVDYDNTFFEDPKTVAYEPFDDSGVSDGLLADLIGMKIMFGFGILLIVVAEIWIVDCYVSYYRGRGFIKGYGHHRYIYGYSNPRYIKARDEYNATHGKGKGGFGGGGCACACACACAGGDRAGCSQKDTYKK